MRIPAVRPIESRDGTLAKDEMMQNLMVDPFEPEKVQKRPAMWKSNLFAPAGQGFGMFVFNDTVYFWTDNGGTGPVYDNPTYGVINNTAMKFVVEYVETDEDPQYEIAGILPYNPCETGYTLNSPDGFPLVKNYMVSSV